MRGKEKMQMLPEVPSCDTQLTIAVSPGGAPEERMPVRNVLGRKGWTFVSLIASGFWPGAMLRLLWWKVRES